MKTPLLCTLAASMLLTACDDTDPMSSETSDTDVSDESGGDDEIDEQAIQAAAADYLDMVQISNQPAASVHGLVAQVQFYADADVADQYAMLDPDNPTQMTFPEGSLLVKEGLDTAGNPDGYFAMYKGPAGYDPEGNDWYWLYVDAAGSVGVSGKAADCSGCHTTDAPMSDADFGVPLGNRL